MLERPLGLLRDIDLPLFQPLDKLIGCEIDDLDIIGLVEEGVWHRLAHADARDLGYDIIQAFDMLDVERGVDIDPGGEQVFDIQVALRVAAAGGICMGKLIDQNNLRVSLEDGVEVHLFENVSMIIGLDARNDFEAFEQGLRFRASMSFDNSDNDVRALGQLCSSKHQHFVGFADAGSRADKHLESAAASILAPRLFKEGIWRRPSYGIGLGHSP